ncbi:MAG: carboxymuconolactone decarboxylase family protein [Ezakiella sp.]|nr:carboxymuconolactone decarboxylase family protein [Ezakiella sp.]MDD7761413.1 carboxymuconolactone decarboxylase family protein [Bacillota bacterium]MDY3946496.1 carboxymuconolactone decarboxylase family protein [Ezakiella sp.]
MKSLLSLILAVMLALTTIVAPIQAADANEVKNHDHKEAEAKPEAKTEEKKDDKKVGLFEQYNPDVKAATSAASAEVFKDRVLTLKQKEMIALAIAVAVKCDGCISFHAKQAVKAGCNMEELSEMVGVNIMMGGGPASSFGSKALTIAKEAGAREAEAKKELKPVTPVKAIDKKDEDKSLLEKYFPEYAAKQPKISEAVMREGYLTVKEKELISLAIAIAVRCDACIKYHSGAAVKAGCTMEELAEMAAVCIVMGGGPSSASSRTALELCQKAIDESKPAK